jgi:hypothetical protein
MNLVARIKRLEGMFGMESRKYLYFYELTFMCWFRDRFGKNMEAAPPSLFRVYQQYLRIYEACKARREEIE